MKKKLLLTFIISFAISVPFFLLVFYAFEKVYYGIADLDSVVIVVVHIALINSISVVFAMYFGCKRNKSSIEKI